MVRKTCLVLGLSLLICSAGCAANPADKAKAFEKKLQGVWIAFEGEASGEPTLLAGYGIAITGDSYTTIDPEKREGTGTIVLGHSTTPVTILFVREDGEPIAKGVVGFRDDNLMLCINTTKEAAPTSFTTSPETHAIMMVYRRE